MECIDQVEAEMQPPGPASSLSQPRPVPGAPHLRRAWGFAVGL